MIISNQWSHTCSHHNSFNFEYLRNLAMAHALAYKHTLTSSTLCYSALMRLIRSAVFHVILLINFLPAILLSIVSILNFLINYAFLLHSALSSSSYLVALSNTPLFICSQSVFFLYACQSSPGIKHIIISSVLKELQHSRSKNDEMIRRTTLRITVIPHVLYGYIFKMSGC